MAETTPEVKPGDVTPSPSSAGEPKTEPDLSEAEKAKRKLAEEVENLQKAKDEALQELQTLRQEKKEEAERVAAESIDPTSQEYLTKVASQAAERVNRRERAAEIIRAKHGISLSDWESKVLPRYVPLSGERSITGTADDYEAAVRAALPETIAKSVETKLRAETIQLDATTRDTQVNASASTTIARNSSVGTKLTAVQVSMKRAEEIASGRKFTDEEFLEKYGKTGSL